MKATGNSIIGSNIIGNSKWLVAMVYKHNRLELALIAIRNGFKNLTEFIIKRTTQ